MQNKNIKTLKELAKKGGLATFLILGLNACNDNSNQNNQSNGTFTNASQQEGAFVIVEKALDGSYKIADEFPAAKTTIVLRNPDGTERILSQEEIDKLVKEEEAKIDAGTSPLTNPEMSSGGMGLGGVLLSSIAGAMIGSWLGNKLFNNQNFQSKRQLNTNLHKLIVNLKAHLINHQVQLELQNKVVFLVVIIKIQAKTIIVQNLQLKVQEVDMKLEKIEALTPEYLESIGFTWHTDMMIVHIFVIN
ncbi:hypothetical protein MASR2M54_26100 [Aliarcobacter cryaerophilus]